MAKISKVDMSCARVQKYNSADISKAERHNERKNETYENMNVVEERIPFNVHFKEPIGSTYMETLKQMEKDGKVSLRGLRQDATLFNEIVIDVNTMYFERNGGYEYAKEFYEEAFHFIEEKFGADNVISAVMHADEINKAVSEDLGKEVYHYHLHAMVVTPSRLHAVRYVQEFKRQIKEKGLNDLEVLVAFSGEVKDNDDVFTEEGMNKEKEGKTIKEKALPETFHADDYGILVVAEKYQTGFDEPLLHTMFVDKKLSGVKAVQTLSRLWQMQG